MDKKEEYIEEEIKEKLKQYTKGDIIFLKKEWIEKINLGDFDFFRKIKGANLHVVYDILDFSKIKKLERLNMAIDIQLFFIIL